IVGSRAGQACPAPYRLVKTMAKKKTRIIKPRSKKASKKIVKPTSARNQKSQGKPLSNLADKGPPAPSISLSARPSPSQTVDDSQVFTIEIDSIRAETTI